MSQAQALMSCIQNPLDEAVVGQTMPFFKNETFAEQIKNMTWSLSHCFPTNFMESQDLIPLPMQEKTRIISSSLHRQSLSIQNQLKHYTEYVLRGYPRNSAFLIFEVVIGDDQLDEVPETFEVDDAKYTFIYSDAKVIAGLVTVLYAKDQYRADWEAKHTAGQPFLPSSVDTSTVPDPPDSLIKAVDMIPFFKALSDELKTANLTNDDEKNEAKTVVSVSLR